ncbi:acyl carrier protein [Streptomyces sp. NPDC058469]|uniref:acyl carrier protein n=1 Tax=Streptomyces sp. NPDC058469 TaxID=3346514 RepID=UPI003660684B
MSRSDVIDRVRTFLAPHMGEHVLADEEDIFAAGIVNSLFAMQLVVFIEGEFQVTVTPEDLDIDRFRSISAIADLVLAKTGAVRHA